MTRFLRGGRETRPHQSEGRSTSILPGDDILAMVAVLRAESLSRITGEGDFMDGNEHARNDGR